MAPRLMTQTGKTDENTFSQKDFRPPRVPTLTKHESRPLNLTSLNAGLVQLVGAEKQSYGTSSATGLGSAMAKYTPTNGIMQRSRTGAYINSSSNPVNNSSLDIKVTGAGSIRTLIRLANTRGPE